MKPTIEYKVSVRGGFSDRMGLKPINTTQQISDLDSRTRTQIINEITDIIQSDYSFDYNDEYMQGLIKDVYKNVYQQEVDNTQHYNETFFLNCLKDSIRSEDYDSVLTLIEYICQRLPRIFPSQDPYKRLNNLFEREYVGYRFVGGIITPITSDVEVYSVNQAIENVPDQVSIHLQKALELLADRVSPDYENSIKESITAVEAQCGMITGEKTLGKALAKLEKNGVNIHPKLKDAFNMLYAFTCDGKGIRHAGNINTSDSTFAEAEFMMVACSAFINYLRCIESK